MLLCQNSNWLGIDISNSLGNFLRLRIQEKVDMVVAIPPESMFLALDLFLKVLFS